MQKINYLFPFKQLRCITKLGEGAFGTVFLVEETETKKKFALKRCVKKQKYVSREIQMLHMFKDKEFIVQIEAAFYTRDLRRNLISNILLELKPLTLYQLIYNNKLKGKRLDEVALKKLLKPIVLGLQVMHNMNVAHRDLKPENILLSEDLEPTIGDIGSAKKLDPRKRNNPHICTLYYRAPELIWGSDSYTVQVDIWSLRCIIIELIYQKPLFYCTQEEHIFPAILHKLGGFNNKVRKYYQRNVIKFGSDMVWDIDKIFDEEQKTFESMKQKGRISPLLQDLLQKIFNYIPDERLTAAQVLAHPFFLKQDQRHHQTSQYGQQRQNNQNYGLNLAQNHGFKPTTYQENQLKEVNQTRFNEFGQKQIIKKQDSAIFGQLVQSQRRGQYKNINRFGKISSQGFLSQNEQEIRIVDTVQMNQQKQGFGQGFQGQPVNNIQNIPQIFQEGHQQQIFGQGQVPNIFGQGQVQYGERQKKILPIFGQWLNPKVNIHGQGQQNDTQTSIFGQQQQQPLKFGQEFGQFQGIKLLLQINSNHIIKVVQRELANNKQIILNLDYVSQLSIGKQIYQQRSSQNIIIY